jgi:hypothetical protein
MSALVFRHFSVQSFLGKEGSCFVWEGVAKKLQKKKWSFFYFVVWQIFSCRIGVSWTKNPLRPQRPPPHSFSPPLKKEKMHFLTSYSLVEAKESSCANVVLITDYFRSNSEKKLFLFKIAFVYTKCKICSLDGFKMKQWNKKKLFVGKKFVNSKISIPHFFTKYIMFFIGVL